MGLLTLCITMFWNFMFLAYPDPPCNRNFNNVNWNNMKYNMHEWMTFLGKQMKHFVFWKTFRISLELGNEWKNFFVDGWKFRSTNCIAKSRSKWKSLEVVCLKSLACCNHSPIFSSSLSQLNLVVFYSIFILVKFLDLTSSCSFNYLPSLYSNSVVGSGKCRFINYYIRHICRRVSGSQAPNAAKIQNH